MDDWNGLEGIDEILETRGLEGAAAALEKRLAADPHPLGWYNLGILKKQLGNLLPALECFEKAAGLAPDEAEIWNEIGLVYDEQGRLTAAEGFYQKAVGLDPSFSKAWNNWGVCAFLKEDFAEAKKRFEKAVVLDPESSSAWFNLRDTCRELNDSPGAAAAQNRLDALGVHEEE